MLQVQAIELFRIKPWENNPRINDHAVDAVAESIRLYGFNVPVLCDQSLTIIAGHTRYKAAIKLGLEKIPVIILEMTDEKRRAFAIADNKTAEIASWDFPKLKEALEQLQSEDIDIRSLGFSEDEMRRFILDEKTDEDVILKIEDSSTITQPGDLYVMGNHRLLCGDSRNTDSVMFLIESRTIDHIFGGPPYFNQRSYSHWDDYPSYLEDMRTIINNCHSIIKDGGVCVWNIANGCSTHHDHVSNHSKLFEESGFKYLDNIIWKKTGANYAIPRNFHIMRNSYYYPALEWEALLVYQKPGNMPKMTREGRDYMAKYHTDVWEISAVTNQLKQYGHPAVCPVEIPYRSMQAYSGSNDIIFEPFGGSGTTLIAAEKTLRKACLMELSPAYCDIIVARWENFTGEKAIRIPR
ncbi:MAG: DNA modification methylase [Dehalococcoidales bacterium]|nr:MAG: DNA modification methylase [Dehalococcoidales bacterium]